MTSDMEAIELPLSKGRRIFVWLIYDIQVYNMISKCMISKCEGL